MPELKKKKVGWGAKKPAATPLSVEELVRKKREADAAAAKVCLFYCCEILCAMLHCAKRASREDLRLTHCLLF
jgi:hypothetical protein